MNSAIESLLKLKIYCEDEGYKGWDPYDGLNSKIFQLLPLKYFSVTRWVWIQLFKRSPINLRKLFLVPKKYNSKGLALLLSGYCNLYLLAEGGDKSFGLKSELYQKIVDISKLLESKKVRNYSGDCWGYSFDWQARRLFFFPKNTPTVVATSFCAEALFQAYEVTKDKLILESAISSGEFIVNDLKRIVHNSGFLFSYSPLDGNNSVYNATLLGAKVLSMCYKYTGDNKYKELAYESIKAVCEGQSEDGSWIYGLLRIQSWKDSFHTGYNLESIAMYKECTKDDSFDPYIEKGFDYYITHFFKEDGTPKYYHDKTYPIDIHCSGQLFSTLLKLNKYNSHSELAKKVLDWTTTNMQDQRGFFYYQFKNTFSSKISYMRWSNAFMFNALTNLVIAEKNG